MSIEEVLANSDTKKFLLQTIKQSQDDENYYAMILNQVTLPHDFVYDNIDIFNLEYLIRFCKLTNKTIISLFEDEFIDNHILLRHQQLPTDTLIKYIEKVIDTDEWIFLQEYQCIPCNIFERYKSKLDWKIISEHQFFDIKFMFDNVKNIHWSQLVFNPRMKQYVNEGIITLYQDTDIWDTIGYCDNVDVSKMLEYQIYFTLDSWKSLLEYREEDLSIEQLELVKAKIEELKVCK